MISPTIWFLVLTYAVVSAVRPPLIHRVLSIAVVSLLGLIEIISQEASWVQKAGWTLLATVLAASCVLLTPIQALLLGHKPAQEDRYPDVYVPPDDRTIKVDIVAVHGLGSRPESAWVHQETKFNWLKQLPQERGVDARVIVHYHNTQWQANSQSHTLNDLGNDLLRRVKALREDLGPEQRKRPIIFIGYSFGGLIVKQAMVLHSRADIIDKKLLGILFLGTPHHGSSFTLYGEILSVLGHWVGSSTHLLHITKRGSLENSSLHRSFVEIFQDMGKRLVNGRETVPEYLGRFPITQVVSEDETRLDIGERAAFASDHRGLQRFPSADGATYRKLLDELKGLLAEIEKSTRSIGHEIDEETRLLNQEIDKIPSTPGAHFKDADHDEDKCAPETRKQLLLDIEAWADDAQDLQGFWLQGMAGTGKSTIARTIASRLSDRFAVCSFFFKRGAGDRGRARTMVINLLKQLASEHDNLKKHLMNAYNSNPAAKGHALTHQWRDLIQTPLKGIDYPTILLIVDAVDECEKSQINDNSVLDFLLDNDNFRGLNLKRFVTARPQGAEEGTDVHKLFRLHDIHKDTVKSDIVNFLDFKFKSKSKKRPFSRSVFPTAKQIDQLAERATPLFIAAVTSFEFVTKGKFDLEGRFNLLMAATEPSTSGSQSSSEFVSQAEAGLDSMYLAVITEALTKDDTGLELDQNLINDNIRRYQDVVGSVLMLKDTLSCQDLALLLIPDSGIEEKETVGQFLGEFRSIMKAPESPEPIEIFHQSLPDFCKAENRVKMAWDNQPKSSPNLKFEDVYISTEKKSADLFENCLMVMEKRMEQPSDASCFKEHKEVMNICRLRGPGDVAETISEATLHETIPPPLRYACKYWVAHFVEGNQQARQERLLEFLRQHLLHWIETMSCLGILDDALMQLDQLQDTLQDSHKDLNSLLIDAQRCIRQSKDGIEQAPLQVYYSALLFAPENSIVRQIFYSGFQWLELPPRVTKNWSAKLLEFRVGSGVRAVKISAGGKFLATLNQHSAHQLEIYKPQTGTLVSKAVANILTRHQPRDAKYKEMFDVSDKFLAWTAESTSNALKIRDIMNGRSSEFILREHSASILGICFSRCGRWLASHDIEGTIIIRDTDHGFSYQVLQGAFLGRGRPKDHAIAFSSWDTKREKTQRTSHIAVMNCFHDGEEYGKYKTTITILCKEKNGKWEHARRFSYEYNGVVVSDLTCLDGKLLFAIWDYANDSKTLTVVGCDLRLPGCPSSSEVLSDARPSPVLDRRSPKVAFLLRQNQQSNQSLIKCAVCTEREGIRIYDLWTNCKSPTYETLDQSCLEGWSGIITSPDHSLIMSLRDFPEKILLWNTTTKRRVVALAANMRPSCIFFTESASVFFAVVCGDGGQVWDATAIGHQQHEHVHPPPILASYISADEKEAAIVQAVDTGPDSDESVVVKTYDLSSTDQQVAEPTRTSQPFAIPVISELTDVLLSKNRKWLALDSQTHVRIWSVGPHDRFELLLLEAKGYSKLNHCAVFSLDSQSVAWGNWSSVTVAYLDEFNRLVKKRRTFDATEFGQGRILSLTVSSDPSRFYILLHDDHPTSEGDNMKLIRIGGSENSSWAVCHTFYDSIIPEEVDPYLSGNQRIAVAPDGETVAASYGTDIYLRKPRSLTNGIAFTGESFTFPLLSFSFCEASCCIIFRGRTFNIDEWEQERALAGESEFVGKRCNRRFSLSIPPLKRDWLYWKGKPLLWLPGDYTGRLPFLRDNTVQLFRGRQPTWLRLSASSPILDELVEKQPLDQETRLKLTDFDDISLSPFISDSSDTESEAHDLSTVEKMVHELISSIELRSRGKDHKAYAVNSL